MHQADHDPKPEPETTSRLREIPDPDAMAQAPLDAPPPNVLIVKQNTSRGISPRAALALLTLLLALGGLTARGLLSDWQGLWTESQDRWTAHGDNGTTTPPAPNAPAEPLPGDLLAAAPQQQPAQAAEPAQKPEPEAVPQEEEDDNDTKAALADIEQEVERKRKEQEELEKLRKQVERDAPPPARPDPRVRRFGFAAPVPINPRDRQQLARMIREQQLRQIREMERIFGEMERARANGQQGWPPMMPRLPRPNFEQMLPPAPNMDDQPRFVPAPPEPGLPDFAPPSAWPGLNNNRQPDKPRPPRLDNRA